MTDESLINRLNSTDIDSSEMKPLTNYEIDRVVGERAGDMAADIATDTFWAYFYSGRTNSNSILAIRWATLLFCLSVWGLVVAGIAAWLY